MKKLILCIWILFIVDIASAGLEINVIYPRPGQEIAIVDSTFIFGNITSGASLFINDELIPVYKSGGWIAFQKVQRGDFVFHLVAFKDGDSTSLDWPVRIGPIIEFDSTGGGIVKGSIRPTSKAIYSVGDLLEFSFEAPSNGCAYFKINNRQPVEMIESDSSIKIENLSMYRGYYQFTESDTGSHRISYEFSANRWEALTGNFITIDTLLSVLPDYPPVIGVFKGTSQIVRTGPYMGYKLLYQPPGINVLVTGMVDGFYKIALAENINAYVNVDSVSILSPETSLPAASCSGITIDKVSDGVIISAEIGAKMPFEVNENLNPQVMDIDIFGVKGDVDRIRYNSDDKFIKMARWSQPQDDLFRISIDFGEGKIKGYTAGYQDKKFVIHIKKKSNKHGMFSKSLKGVRIVVDPGHSHDAGAVGPTGLREEDPNLWIGQELRTMLERKGAKVLMTRYGHEDVPLYDRPAMAEKFNADILVSIHNNALPDGKNPFTDNGTSTYYYHPHSKPLAEAIQKRLLHATGLPDYGLYYGNLALTRPSSFPAVLVECAFMMIPEQEAMLKNEKFRKKCARAIMEGIEDYLDE